GCAGSTRGGSCALRSSARGVCTLGSTEGMAMGALGVCGDEGMRATPPDLRSGVGGCSRLFSLTRVGAGAGGALRAVDVAAGSVRLAAGAGLVARGGGG